MFKNVLNFTQVGASEYSQAAFTEEFTTVYTLGEELVCAEQIRNSCTCYAAIMLIEQLKFLKTVPYTMLADGQETFTVLRSQNSYSVTN